MFSPGTARNPSPKARSPKARSPSARVADPGPPIFRPVDDVPVSRS